MKGKISITFIFLLLIEVNFYAQGTSLIVDLSSKIGPVTHCASGSLYGITETYPPDMDSLVAPLKPNVFCQPPFGGSGNQHPFGAAVAVSARLALTTGQVQITLADILPGWPYQWPGQTSWLAQVTSAINEKKASGRNNFYGYVIWNERHGTWNASNGDWYSICWKPTYDLIRSLDPNAKIIGPGDSYYTYARMTEFLTWCKDNNCLPDIMCWHELLGSANISSDVNSYRTVESRVGVSPLPISINEYCHPTHDYEGCPGASAPFIAKFERNMVQSACISWWFTNLPGRLGSLLTSSNQKGGGWWFYKWYGDMTGSMVSVTPPNDNSDGIDGFACLDSNKQYASICMGGNYTGPINVIINKIPSSFGDSVTVSVEYVPWSSKDLPVTGTITLSKINYYVSAGSITVPVTISSPLYGYHVSLTPGEKLVAIDKTHELFPGDFKLSQNYPNPFNPSTTISFSIPENGHVKLIIFNTLGRQVATLIDNEVNTGRHCIIWNAGNAASGVYFYRIMYKGKLLYNKMLLLK